MNRNQKEGNVKERHLKRQFVFIDVDCKVVSQTVVTILVTAAQLEEHIVIFFIETKNALARHKGFR